MGLPREVCLSYGNSCIAYVLYITRLNYDANCMHVHYLIALWLILVPEILHYGLYMCLIFYIMYILLLQRLSWEASG